MIFVKCAQCENSWFVQGKPGEVENLLGSPEWTESFPCPTALCEGRALRAGGLEGARKHSLSSKKVTCTVSAEQFLRGIVGLGEGALLKTVKSLFLRSRVVAIDAHPKGTPERTIIKSLTFADGTKMKFGISQVGACIYNIEEAKNALHHSGTVKSSDSNREETGRVATDEVPRGELGSESGSIFHSATTVESAGTSPMPPVSKAGELPTRKPTSTDESDGDHSRVRV